MNSYRVYLNGVQIDVVRANSEAFAVQIGGGDKAVKIEGDDLAWE